MGPWLIKFDRPPPRRTTLRPGRFPEFILPLADEIRAEVEGHDGRLWVRSELARDAIFCVRLPLLTSSESQERATPAPLRTNSDSFVRTATRQIRDQIRHRRTNRRINEKFFGRRFFPPQTEARIYL